MGGAKLTDYCGSKAALVGLDESLRMELRQQNAFGVKTMVVCPYVVNTGMFRGAFSTTEDGRGRGRGSGGGRGREGETKRGRCRSMVEQLRNLLVPTLSANDVAEAVVEETGKRLLPSWRRSDMMCGCFSSCNSHGRVVVLPRRLSLVPSLLRLLPIALQEWIIDVSGGTEGMRGFHGQRRRKENKEDNDDEEEEVDNRKEE